MKKIDFHAHILPGCDHGCDCVDTSLRQLTLARAAGVDIVCATPHFYAEREDVHEFLMRRRACFEELSQAVSEYGKALPEVFCGAEVLAFAGIERLPELKQLCLGETNLLLLEMPFVPWQTAVIDSVRELLGNPDYEIVLAHAERYDAGDIEQLAECGAMIQCNAGELKRLLLRRSVRSWLDQEKLVAMGSDIHGASNAYQIWSRAEKRHSEICSRILCRTECLLGMGN